MKLLGIRNYLCITEKIILKIRNKTEKEIEPCNMQMGDYDLLKESVELTAKTLLSKFMNGLRNSPVENRVPSSSKEEEVDPELANL